MINRSNVFRLLREKKGIGLGNVLFSEFVRSHGQPQTPVSTDSIVAALGIRIENQSLAANGYLIYSSGQPTIVVNKNRSEPIRRFAVAHELAHFLLWRELGIKDSTDSLSTAEKQVLERACDQFASRVLAPDYAIVREMDSAKKELSISILEHAAAALQVPLRAVIASLRSSGILNAAEMGVIVLKPMSNPSTGIEWDIRLWQAALPWWGHLPEFQRVGKAGFRSIRREWSSLPWRAETTLNEEICVSERSRPYADQGTTDAHFRSAASGSVEGKAWVRGVRKTVEITYKIYKNPDEGVFIVGIFPWRKPVAICAQE